MWKYLLTFLLSYLIHKISTNKNVAQTKKDSKQTMQLTLKRIDTYETEFDLLYCSLNSAKIFFTDR